MKRFTNIAIILLLFISCRTINISIDDIGVIKNRIVYYRTTYESTIYRENGEFIEGEKIKIITEYFDINDNIIMVLDEADNILFYISEYDDTGSEIGIKTYDEQGNFLYSNAFTLNSDGKIISIINYDENGNYLAELRRIYDFDGNMLKEIVYGENGKFIDYRIYVYNNEKIYSVIEYFYTNEFPAIKINSYDIDGRLTQIEIYYEGFTVLKTLIEYDDMHREIKRVDYIYDSNQIIRPSKIKYYEYHQY